MGERSGREESIQREDTQTLIPLGRAESQKLHTFTLEQSVVCQQLMSGSRSHYYYKPLIL